MEVLTPPIWIISKLTTELSRDVGEGLNELLAVTRLRRTEMCEHHKFDATVRVARIEDKGRFMAEVKIKCLDCGVPMQFMGLQPGLNFDGATVSLDGLEMNIGIHPQGQRPNPMQKLLGYSVEAHN